MIVEITGCLAGRVFGRQQVSDDILDSRFPGTAGDPDDVPTPARTRPDRNILERRQGSIEHHDLPTRGRHHMLHHRRDCSALEGLGHMIMPIVIGAPESKENVPCL